MLVGLVPSGQMRNGGGSVIQAGSFACLLLLSATLLSAQDSPKSVRLADKSTVPADEISKGWSKECPDVSMTDDPAKSGYTLEAFTTITRYNGPGSGTDVKFDFTLFDRDGNIFSSASETSLGHAVKRLCHAIKTSIVVEVVDTQNLTQTSDAQGDTTGGIVGSRVNGLTGRRTHTDNAMIYIIVNGEHALLDCYERRTGCPTIGPGKYYGELDGHDGIWVNHQIPITHKQVRDHYKIAGSW
jgi:hypothetical protein